MSDGVELHNLLPDPKPVATAKWVVPSSRDVSVRMLDSNRLHLTNNADNADSYAYTQVALPAGTYRFGVEVSDPQGAPPAKLLRVVIPPRTELTPATWDGHAGRVVTPPNTLPADGTLEFRVMVGPNPNCAVWVRQLFVMSEEDYQHMLSQDITWFDGDSIVRGGGFLLTACIHMWIAALLWWWSHEQAHHPTRRAAGHGVQKLCAHAETWISHRLACGGGPRTGCGRDQGRHPAQPLRAWRDREHTDTIARLAVLDDHAHRGGGHTRPIQNRYPFGHRQGWRGPLRGDIQLHRGQLQTVAFRRDAARRNGRIPCDRSFQRILFVSREHATRLVVAA